MIMLSFLDLAEEGCFGHAYIFHPCDMASPAQLHLKQNGLYAGQARSLKEADQATGAVSPMLLALHPWHQMARPCAK